jgi:hypothetical protein
MYLIHNKPQGSFLFLYASEPVTSRPLFLQSKHDRQPKKQLVTLICKLLYLLDNQRL